jgi:hypothetical protein
MKTSEMVSEPQLAFALWQTLEALSNLLWERYENDFLNLTEEEGSRQADHAQEEIDIPF